jgi:hypothetical protein
MQQSSVLLLFLLLLIILYMKKFIYACLHKQIIIFTTINEFKTSET